MWLCSDSLYKDMCTVTVGNVRRITTSITGKSTVNNEYKYSNNCVADMHGWDHSCYIAQWLNFQHATRDVI